MNLPPSTNSARVAYLTSQYPATSHTFIRREIAAVRALGLTVETFSIRTPAQEELHAEDDRREADATFTVLSRPLREFLAAHVRQLFSRPAAYATTFLLALSHRPPGVRSALLAVAHFGESILLAEQLHRRKIDHLHNHFANSGATVGLLASRYAKISWSFTIHGISEFDYPAGVNLPAKVAAAKFVACVSYFGRAQAARMVDACYWPKLNIVRCGLELNCLPVPVCETRSEIRMIFVGRLSAEKGLPGLLEAMSLMKSGARSKLVIVGDGPLRARLERQCKALGFAERVEFLGRLPEADTLVEIASSDVLVLPSFMEGLPIVLMEALALGVPVVASRVAGIPELVEDGQTGLLFSASNWTELADALDRLVSNQELREHLGLNGPVRIADEFDVRTSAAKLRDLFQAAAVGSVASPQAPPVLEDQNTSALSKGRKEAA